MSNPDHPLPPAPPPEFSRRIPVDAVGANGLVKRIEASAGERAALARRLTLQAVETLSAELTLRRVRGAMIEVTGQLSAEVVQTCVVTLEPVTNNVAESFGALFAPAHLIPEITPEMDFDPLAEGEEDWPEPLDGGAVDIGELVAQHLSLALDPYPRRPGVEFNEDDADALAAASGPFAALARLKGKG